MPGNFHVADAVLTQITPKGKPGTSGFHHELTFTPPAGGAALTIDCYDAATVQSLQVARAQGKTEFRITLDPVS